MVLLFWGKGRKKRGGEYIYLYKHYFWFRPRPLQIWIQIFTQIGLHPWEVCIRLHTVCIDHKNVINRQIRNKQRYCTVVCVRSCIKSRQVRVLNKYWHWTGRLPDSSVQHSFLLNSYTFPTNHVSLLPTTPQSYCSYVSLNFPAAGAGPPSQITTPAIHAQGWYGRR